MERKKGILINRTKLCCSTVSFFLVLSISTFIFITANGSNSITTCLLDSSRCPMLGKTGMDFQELDETEQSMVYEDKTVASMGWARRLLGGPGSSPPRCTAKCGKCTPCRPVHVPVPPGTPVTAEYYPEAWRCKCGNRLYMP